MSQRDYILGLLADHPEGVCAMALVYDHHIGRPAARIAELRDDGWPIVTAPCALGHRHENRQIMYAVADGVTVTRDGDCVVAIEPRDGYARRIIHCEDGTHRIQIINDRGRR